MNIIEKIKNNRYRKKLIKEIGKNKLNKFCLKMGININYLSNYFLNLLVKYPNFLDEIINNNLEPSVLVSINNNTYTLKDIGYDNLWLLKYLEFKDVDRTVIDIIKNSSKETIFLDSKYYFISCNTIEELSSLNVEKPELIPSYFEEINITADIIKTFKIKEFTLNDAPITICNPADNNKVILDPDLNLFYKGELLLNENTIIYIDYDKFLELSKDKEFLKTISKCQIIFKKNFETKMFLSEKSIRINDFMDNMFIKNSNSSLLKINHILYIVNNSDLSLEQKEVYTYQIIKYYQTLEEKDSFLKYRNYNNFKQIISELQEKIGLEKIRQLTNEFNEQDTNIKLKKIEPLKFSATIFINSIYNFDSISINSLLKRINDLSPEEIEIVLNDNRIIAKLKEIFGEESTLEVRKNIISRELALSNYSLNHYVINFIRKLNIDIERFIALDESVIEEPKFINSLIYRYGIIGGIEETNICISQVVGYDISGRDGSFPPKKNVLLSMGEFFGDSNSGYHTRSLGMLDYTSEEIVSKLQYSFMSEPMVLDEADKNKYCISINGMHRYTVLRIHYLLEKLKNKIPEEELNKKYSIPVKVRKRDYFKTYCNYLLSLLDSNLDYISAHLDSDCKYTGLVKVVFKDGEEKIMSDLELKELVSQSIKNINDSSLSLISYNYNNYQTFKEFIDNNFEELKLLIMKQKGETVNEDYKSGKSYH